MRRQGKDVDMHVEKGIVNQNEYRYYIVTWNGSTLKIFKKGHGTPFMEFTDGDPLEVHFFGIMTGWGSEGDWNLINYRVVEGRIKL